MQDSNPQHVGGGYFMGYLQDTAEGLLYTPDNRLYWQPSHFGLDYDKLTFFSEKGRITAWHLHA